jgi:hypothetical protein
VVGVVRGVCGESSAEAGGLGGGRTDAFLETRFGEWMQNAAKKIATCEICMPPSTGPKALNQKSRQITDAKFRSMNLSLSRPMP